MNRTIKFRGMTLNGKWVYGNVSIVTSKSPVPKGTYISNEVGMPFAYEVRPETVGQYIGRKDKTETDIYEGDRVQIHSCDYRNYVIQYNERTTEFLARREDGGWAGMGIATVVIGNIYESD